MSSRLDKIPSLASRERALLEDRFGWKIRSERDCADIVRQQISPEIIFRLIQCGFKKSELCWIVQSQTLRRRLQKFQLLTHDESAKVIRVARLVVLAECVFDDIDKALEWLSKPKQQLNGLTPKETMQDEFGARFVEQLLHKIDSGFY